MKIWKCDWLNDWPTNRLTGEGARDAFASKDVTIEAGNPDLCTQNCPPWYNPKVSKHDVHQDNDDIDWSVWNQNPKSGSSANKIMRQAIILVWSDNFDLLQAPRKLSTQRKLDDFSRYQLKIPNNWGKTGLQGFSLFGCMKTLQTRPEGLIFGKACKRRNQSIETKTLPCHSVYCC